MREVFFCSLRFDCGYAALCWRPAGLRLPCLHWGAETDEGPYSLMRRILLVNPWITDVAAFDLWAWPLGLLYWAAWLREWGFAVELIDCTDRAHPALGEKRRASRRFHTGKYHAEPYVPQPESALRAGHLFRRYGLPVEAFDRELARCESRWGGPPDAILVTSRMTYWYHGVRDAIAHCRDRWPRAPVVLGGVYAALCPDHARRHSGADLVVEGDGFADLTQWLRERFPGGPGSARLSSPKSSLASGKEPPGRVAFPGTPSPDPETWPVPAFDLCHSHAALPLMTSVGCPFDCSYCASKLLAGRFRRRSPDSVAREFFAHRARWGTTDFAFYDDALLVDPERSLEPFLDRVIESGAKVRFHTPNGLHYQMIGPRIAGKMRAAGFETIRLSLETARDESLRAWGRSGGKRAFFDAVAALREVGFARAQIGAYVMGGMPGQSADEVRASIDAVCEAGAAPYLNEFSPIPGTAEWRRALEVSGTEIADDPLWHNNSLYRARPEACLHAEFPALKQYAVRSRQ